MMNLTLLKLNQDNSRKENKSPIMGNNTDDHDHANVLDMNYITVLYNYC